MIAYLTAPWGGREIGTPVCVIGSEGEAPVEALAVDAHRFEALLACGLASGAAPEDRPRKRKERT